MIIIFEGIASSGKTTLIERLAQRLSCDGIVKVVTEATTLLPVVENSDPDRALNYLREVHQSIDDNQCDYILIDRYLLTHAFRTHAKLAAFKELEQRLQEAGAGLVFLYVNPAAIAGRLLNTVKLRGSSWKYGYGGSFSEKTVYYVKQQTELLELRAETKLSSLLIDTTDAEWDEYIEEIVRWSNAIAMKLAA